MGRPQFAQSGTQGSGQTVAVNNRPEIESITQNQSGDLAAGGGEITEIYAPTGAVYQVTNAFLRGKAIGSATSGRHEIIVKSAGSNVMVGGSVYNSVVEWDQGYWSTADERQYPPNEVVALQLMHNLRATENRPLGIVYKNNTDATQTQERSVSFDVIEESY